MSAASKGRSAEWVVRDVLRKKGYIVGRMAASKGPFDIIALNAWECLLVAVRKERWPPPGVRRALIRCEIAPFIRLLVARTRRGTVEFAIPMSHDDTLIPVPGPLPIDTTGRKSQ